MSAGNIYASRNPEAQGEHYLRHIDRMTAEHLHSKSAIASELAHRDMEIDQLKALNAELAAALELIDPTGKFHSYQNGNGVGIGHRLAAALAKQKETT